MARPRLAVPFDVILDAYERTGSVRGAAERLTISRWVVERRLVEAGVPVLERDDALAQVRLLRAAGRGTVRTDETVRHLGAGRYGHTIVRRCRSVPFVACVWEGCEQEARVGAVCDSHASVMDGPPGCHCAWCDCKQDVISTALCGYHDKLARGLIQRPA